MLKSIQMKGILIEILRESEERSFHQMRYGLSGEGGRAGRTQPCKVLWNTSANITHTLCRSGGRSEKDLDEKHSSLKIFISLEKGPWLNPTLSRATS